MKKRYYEIKDLQEHLQQQVYKGKVSKDDIARAMHFTPFSYGHDNDTTYTVDYKGEIHHHKIKEPTP